MSNIPPLGIIDNSHNFQFPVVQIVSKLTGIFSEIALDQSTEAPSGPIYRSKWSDRSKAKVADLKARFEEIDLNNNNFNFKNFESLEELFFRLSKILRLQVQALELKGTELMQSSMTVIDSSHSFVNGKWVEEGPRIEIGGMAFKESDSTIALASNWSDNVCFDIFSIRFSRGEVNKAIDLFAKMNPQSDKQNDALLKIVSYINVLFDQNKLTEIAALYTQFLDKEKKLNLLVKVVEKLKAKNQEKNNAVIPLLDPNSINLIKGWIGDGKNDPFKVRPYIQFLMLDRKNLDWCVTQVQFILESSIPKSNDGITFDLIDHCLLHNCETHELAMKYIHDMIKFAIKKNQVGTVCKLINKYLWNEPSTQEVALNYIHTMLQYHAKKGWNGRVDDWVRDYNLSQNLAFRSRLMICYCDLAESKIKEEYFRASNEYVAKIDSYVNTVIQKGKLAEEDQNAFKHIVSTFSRYSNTNDKVFMWLSLVNAKVQNPQLVKDLAQLCVQNLRDSEKANLVKMTFL